MSVEADVIRYASPWPGKAAQILEALATLDSGEWSVDRICATTGIPILPGDAIQILDGLTVAGVCRRSADGNSWICPLQQTEIRRLATLLWGAEYYRRLRLETLNLELAISMPLAPSHLESQLPTSPGRLGGFMSTYEAFSRVASSAQSRLVVMTPFIDRSGFYWLRHLFVATGPDIERIVILRDAEQYAAELSVHHAEWLQTLRVVVKDYHLPHSPESGRALPIETFHAKIVLADTSLAYVGSANFLGSGDGTSLEAGVLIDGPAAIQVARLVKAVLQVARSL